MDAQEPSKFGDTPERSKFVGTPISKFEDSPVFNFINSLSPIQPVKSVHSIHTFHSPGSATVASVFSSPHVSLHKESRFFIRHPFPDSVKHVTSSDFLVERNIPPAVSTSAVLSTSNALVQDNSNMTCSLNMAAVDPADENSTQPYSSGSVQFDSGSPNHNTTPFYGIKLDFKLDNYRSSSEQAQFVPDASDGAQNSFSTDIGPEVEFSVNQIKEDTSESDWKNLISDNTEGFMTSEATTGWGTSKIHEQDNDISLNAQANASFDIFLHNDSQDSHVDDDGGTREQKTLKLLPDICQEEENLDEESQKTEAELDDGSSLGFKLDSQQHRGVRRRCLVFEVAGVSKMNPNNDSNVVPSVILPINEKPTSDNVQFSENNITFIPYVLPGIGLHLNALARTSKDRPISPKTKAPGRELISRPCSIRPYTPTITGEKQPQNALDLHKCQDLSGSELQDNQIAIFDASLTPVSEIEESVSPKKKRRKAENSGENESCRRCNCKKSKCLKLYCECFAAGVYCVEPCSCQGCFNKPLHEETVLATRKQIESRNPLAFAPKVIRTSQKDQEIREESNNKTPASARHKRGCNCKKSNCLKKYCECYQGGVGCSFSCRCEGCKNGFGRKDGFEEIEYDVELACEKELVKVDNDKISTSAPKTKQIQLSESPLPFTPFGACRSSSVKLSFLSGGKPPRTSTLSIMSRPENQQGECKNKENDHIFADADIPENLRVDSSPCSAVKTASPNGKRVSLPLNGFGMSPNIKGGRKLILKSIPSFPSLSNDSPKKTQFTSSVLS